MSLVAVNQPSKPYYFGNIYWLRSSDMRVNNLTPARSKAYGINDVRDIAFYNPSYDTPFIRKNLIPGLKVASVARVKSTSARCCR